MLPPDYLIERIEPVTALYEDLHIAVIGDIARHIRDTLETTGKHEVIPSAAYQAERLNQAGMLYDIIIQRIAEVNSMGYAEVRQLFDDAAVKSWQYDNRVYSAAGLKPVPIPQSPEMLRILEAGLSKTLGKINRLTGTFAINAQSKFEELLNTGYNKVVSGAYSYTRAIEETADALAREGVTSFDYATGRQISVEAAVRMNVLTGSNQTAARITEETMRQLGCSLVRTTAHLGARTHPDGDSKDHTTWQGKIFYWKEMDTGLKSPSDSGTMMPEREELEIAEERRKILDGTYPSRVILGRQRKHIDGTKEFSDKISQLQKIDPLNRPSILTDNAQDIVNQYKGTGKIILPNRGNPYPREIIDIDHAVGLYWVKSLQKYAYTKRVKIFYSSTGVHIVPVGDYKKR